MHHDCPYTPDFYKTHADGSRQSAREIVPLVLELTQSKSVIDVGCGVGTWLSVFREWGVADVIGVDGDWVDRTLLEIPQDRFISRDLKAPIHLGREFDLVVSLEVAEHLPRSCAGAFVDTLTALGPVVLFSAAIPFQHGAGHVNEQWPDYWANLFHARDYAVIDCIRRKVWQSERVEWFYAQNILMFARRNHLDARPLLKQERERTEPCPLAIVHPKKYLEVLAWTEALTRTAQDIAALIPLDEAFIFVDQAHLGSLVTAGRRAIPFLEREGQYWGSPVDDTAALAEFERLRLSGAGFMVFAWPAFWWFSHYPGLHRRLRSEFRCLLENDRVVVFDLRPSGQSVSG